MERRRLILGPEGDDTVPAIRDNLKALRNISGLSQNEVAEALNVARQTISSYETGRTEPDWETLKRLAELYKADIYDVLYGGNRMQRKVTALRRAALGISAVLLLSLLLHSALLLINNTYFVIEDGMTITSENAPLIERRFALRGAADKIAVIGTAVFSVGSLVLLYPLISLRKTYLLKKLMIWLIALVAAIHIVIVPFMLSDKIFGHMDYFLPVFSALPCILLLFIVLIILFCLRRKPRRE